MRLSYGPGKPNGAASTKRRLYLTQDSPFRQIHLRNSALCSQLETPMAGLTKKLCVSNRNEHQLRERAIQSARRSSKLFLPRVPSRLTLQLFKTPSFLSQFGLLRTVIEIKHEASSMQAISLSVCQSKPIS